MARKKAAKKVSKKRAKKVSKKELNRAEPRTYVGFPRFRRRETVEAFQIHSTESMTNGRRELCGLEHSVVVDAAFVDTCHPKPGGYFVKDQDKIFWCEAEKFEKFYTAV